MARSGQAWRGEVRRGQAGSGKDGNFRCGVFQQELTPHWELLNVDRCGSILVWRHLVLGCDLSAAKWDVYPGILLTRMSVAYLRVQPLGTGNQRWEASGNVPENSPSAPTLKDINRDPAVRFFLILNPRYRRWTGAGLVVAGSPTGA